MGRSGGALFAATVAFEVAACVLSWGLEPLYDTLLYALYAIVQAGAGALIASRHPRNPIGWLFLWFALFNAVAADAAQGWALRAGRNGWPGGPVCEWIALWSFIPASVGVILVFLLFPSGRLLGLRWRVVAWVNVVGVALALPGWALSPDDGSAYTDGRNPFAVSAVPGTLLFTSGAVLVCASLVASVVSLVVRFHRSRGVERQQLKWFAFAAAVMLVVPPVRGHCDRCWQRAGCSSCRACRTGRPRWCIRGHVSGSLDTADTCAFVGGVTGASTSRPHSGSHAAPQSRSTSHWHRRSEWPCHGHAMEDHWPNARSYRRRGRTRSNSSTCSRTTVEPFLSISFVT